MTTSDPKTCATRLADLTAPGDAGAGPATPGAAYRYPLMLDVTGRLVVIVGGGAVAARKAAGVAEAGAMKIRCVALAFKAEFPDRVELVVERYEVRHLDGAGLVFAATDSAEVNEAIVRDARARGVLVSRADSGEGPAGDFATPACLRLGAVTVTVSAGSPALSTLIRDGLGARWDERWSQMADAMRALRPALTGGNRLSPGRRAAVLRDLASEAALDVLARGGQAALIGWLAGRHAELSGLSAELDATGDAVPHHA